MSQKREFSGRQSRQGTIVLNTPLRRAIFIGGPVLVVILGLILAYAA